MMRPRFEWLLASVWLAAGCVVSEPVQTAGPCESPEDCPDGYACVTASNFSGRVCELPFPRFQTDVSNIQAFYCREIKAILDRYCISCHGATPAGGAPADFRLDYYEGSPLPGAKAKAERVLIRTKDNTMPPGGGVTDEEKAQLEAWLQKGTPECDAVGTTSLPGE